MNFSPLFDQVWGGIWVCLFFYLLNKLFTNDFDISQYIGLSFLYKESGGRKLNENKALTSKKARFDPYGKNKFSICRICKSSVHQPGSHYCQGCAYKKGICSMCGKKVLDTKNYKQTSV
uniref:Cysteine-rich PDZ-binding protein n=1 Tax=Chrysemys picta bellii TaxID=8478 RepID=A0A8C3FHA5_CHRPI